MCEEENQSEGIAVKVAVEALNRILDSIIERKQEVYKEAKETKEAFAEGQRLAFFEVVDIIRSRLEILDVRLDDRFYDEDSPKNLLTNANP